MWKEQNFLHIFTEKNILQLCIHLKKQQLLSDQFDPLPFSAPETQPEQRAPEKPVQDHSRPDAYNAPSEDPSQYNAEQDPEDPHGHNGYCHCKFHIIGSPQRIGHNK